MSKIRSIIIDDNTFTATVLSDMLEEYHPNIEIIGVAKNGQEGKEEIKRLRPNLIFLDIEMPDMNGFEMLNQLDEINFQTIFTTAHSHYAIKAFRFNALDYLVKPIDEKELQVAINRFQSNSVTTTNQNLVQLALDNLKTKNVGDQKLFLQTQKGELQYRLKEIVKIEGERNYSFIHLSNGKKELSSKTLGYFDEILLDKGFFRCHRSFLVNHIHIERMESNQFLLKDKSSLPISRRKKSEANNWFLNKEK